jgi:RNA polymerase sigma-70 factor (ECF subfamily)
MKRPESRGATRVAAERGLSFADVFDARVDEVYRFVHRRCRDHALAEDITQETFMAAIRTFDEPTEVTISWLVTVARNRLFDVLRRQARHEAKLRLVGVAETDGHDAVLAERLRVESALKELSVDYRLVLTLHYIDGLTVPALAAHLDRSVKSVEGLVTRARRELRARLEEEIDTAEAGDGHG